LECPLLTEIQELKNQCEQKDNEINDLQESLEEKQRVIDDNSYMIYIIRNPIL
jgi:peptidoglycan hydrolase CwlO-like protein